MPDIAQRLKCALGFHDWRRSKFVALCDTKAPLVCRHCRKQKYD